MQWWGKTISGEARLCFYFGGGQKYTKYNKIYNNCINFRRARLLLGRASHPISPHLLAWIELEIARKEMANFYYGGPHLKIVEAESSHSLSLQSRKYNSV